MKIITMATPSYVNWLYHFLSSVKGEVVVYRINFSDKLKRIIELEFPNVLFRDHETEMKLHEKWNPLKKVFKVTYLKGLFCKRAFDEFQDKILWSDCTELILGNLNEFEDKFGDHGFRINRGGQAENKKTFAALFGLFGKRETQKYYQMCQDNKEEWFSDQVALGKLDINEIKQGNWISFNYSEDAKSWSDRGETGNGKIKESDYSFTENKYISYLSQIQIDYTDRFENFMKKLEVPTILVHTDDDNWCYVNSTRKVAELLSNDFDFEFIYQVQKDRDKLLNCNPDLIWGRCSSLRNKKLLAVRPDLMNKCFTSVTTGGESLDNRMIRNVNSLSESGLIVQNKEAVLLAKYYFDKKGIDKPIALLPNGCDIEMFNPINKDKFVVGWNGRAGSGPEKLIKGYDFYKKAVELLGYENLELKGDGINKIPFNELPDKFYDKISVLVLPSNCEGCSNTINEALASGIPVLAFKCGWHGEVMQEYEDGVIWVERSIMDIRDKLKKVKENPELWDKLSLGARRFAEKWSWENVSKDYKEAFNEMIEYTNKLPKIEKKEFKMEIKRPKNYVKVRGLKKVNLGKIERNGATLWFEKGTVRTVPYSGEAKRIIDQNINSRFIEIVN